MEAKKYAELADGNVSKKRGINVLSGLWPL